MELQAGVEQVVLRVGVERFESACRALWRARDAQAVSVADATSDVGDVPHDVADALFAGSHDLLPGADDIFRHQVALDIYRRMPAYGLLMYLPTVRTADVLAIYGPAIRELLDDPRPQIADPVSYHLWCGDFEGDDDVADWAWGVVTADILHSPIRLRRVLEHAGPVPWRLKRDLFEQIGEDPQWRPAVRDSIARGRVDLYGQVDETEAARWDGPGA